ncbi:MAG: M28 family peptidase [Gemmatimonadetes bacterium]|nr:M28 family peptidase [Gemmatimonadota bacterium]
MRMRLIGCAASLRVGAAAGLSAQDLPLLDGGLVRLITQEVSGDAAYEHIRFMTRFHRPGGGADGLWEVAQYVEARARDFGLADVRLIKQAAASRPWNARFADLWLLDPEPERIASTLWTPIMLADYSPGADVTAEVVDVGSGSDTSAYAGSDVSGRIVLAYGPLPRVLAEAVERRGAVGVISYPDPNDDRYVSYPHQIRWSRVPRDDRTGMGRAFAFSLSLRQGLALRARLAARPQPLRARAVVDAASTSTAGQEPWQVMVEAFIRGTDPSTAQDVVLTGHLQEEKFSANDDASGVASVLEVSRALAKLIEEGKLPRPRRNLRFWWVTEISSERQYFADNRDSLRRIWVNINHDMVGANQGQDVLRMQNITRLPATRFHFFNDVVEAVVEYMVATNTSELAQVQAVGGSVGGAILYPKPHLAALGTRHRYNAKMIFFHNNTDHMTFNEAPIGVPGVTFTNWPDNYIHTTDDDLWNIDRTQLGRNAAAAALIAYVMAAVDGRAAPALAAETDGRGAQRIARNLALGLSWLATEPDRNAAYHRAADQVQYAAVRDRLAVSSLAQIGPDAASLVAPMLERVAEREAQALRELEAQVRWLTGRGPSSRPRLTDAEQRLQGLHPALSGGPREFLDARDQIRAVDGLHGLMAFEVLNAVNGERMGLDIYRYVAGEAREAGAHYYGTVTPEAVLQFLENVAEVGLIRLR